MAETLSTLSIVSFAVAGVCLALAVFFWFFFKIPTVFGDLSGRTAKRSIARMRTSGGKAEPKRSEPQKAHTGRGKKSEARTPQPQRAPDPQDRPETGLISDNVATGPVAEGTAVLHENQATSPMSDGTAPLYENWSTSPMSDGTAPLYENPATSPMSDGTAPLHDDPTEGTEQLHEAAAGRPEDEATGLLTHAETAPMTPPTQGGTRPLGKRMTMLDEVMLIHTDEVIR